MPEGFIPIAGMLSVFEALDDSVEGKKAAAEKVKSDAETIAPYDTEGTDRYVDTEGHYKDAFVVIEDPETHEIVLSNTNFKAHWIEWGTATMPPRATIRRAIAMAGYSLREASKP